MSTELVLEFRLQKPGTLATIMKDRKEFRLKKILELHMQDLTQHEIASRLGYSLSTIEKDYRELRNSCKIQEKSEYWK